MKQSIETSFLEIIDKLKGWLGAFIENLPNLLVAIIVMVISFYISRKVSKWITKLASKKIPQESITKLIGRISATVVVLIGLFLALGALDLSKTLNTLLAGAGISGLVIGLALQGTLSNLLSGVILSFRKKVQIGNWVKTTGYEGEIVDISLNSFILKEADNSMVIIPNKTIIENPLKNFSLTKTMRITVECGVGYESNLEEVEKITKKAIEGVYHQNEGTDVEFYYTSFADSSINFKCRFWVDSKDAKNRLEAKSVAIMAIKKAFNTNDINIPFPIRTLEFSNKLGVNSFNKESPVFQN
ncbi:mechanosensitive ion channel family protein [uncultured Maribacter sp.]|uniref:mechanosensitive ion channel family protein n=1 Tax=uncultured Maribacter sp. TaxID=431308 RepID=UPI00261115C6|nr:mechanosensitive ion channel family protein [uncultured Maribacter sp.]